MAGKGRGQLVLLEKRQPPRLPRGIACKLVRQPNRHCIGHGHAAPLEVALFVRARIFGVQSFSFQQHRVLKAAVGHAQQGDGVEFLYDDRVRPVGPQLWCGKFVAGSDRQNPPEQV